MKIVWTRLQSDVMLSYTLIMMGLFVSLVLTQSVIMPFRPAIYANMYVPPDDRFVETNYFDDYTTFYVPEVANHMRAPKSHWLAMWTNSVELGRPLAHLSGFSPAYIGTWILMGFIRDPFVFLTVLFALWVYISGLAALLTMRHIYQNAGVALSAGILYALTPFAFFYNTFPMFVAPMCWGMVLCYGIVRSESRQSFGSWLLIAFSIYSLIYTAYPQIIIHLGYIIIGYTCWRVLKIRNEVRLRFLMVISTAVIVGIIAALPVILETRNGMALSDHRSLVSLAFYASILGSITDLRQAIFTICTYVYSSVIQTTPAYTKIAYQINGNSILSLMGFWSILGVLSNGKKSWGWVIWLFVAAAFSWHRPLFEWGFNHGLPQLSRGVLLGSVTQYLPHLWLATLGMMSRNELPFTTRTRYGIATAILMYGLLATTCVLSYRAGIAIHWNMVALECLLLGTSLWYYMTPKMPHNAIGMWVPILIQALFLVKPYLLTQPYSYAVYDSPTAKEIRSIAGNDGNMALVFNRPTRQLEANYTSMLGINNIGTYSSLPSRYYVNIMRTLGIPFDTYIRNIRSIPEPQSAESLWLTNVRVIASDKPRDIAGTEIITRTDSIYLYRVVSSIGCCAWINSTDVTAQDDIHHTVPIPPPNSTIQLSDIQHNGDYRRIRLPMAPISGLVVLSQQYNADWQAKVVFANGTQQLAQTVIVNSGYQGVLVPAAAQELILEYSSWIWWSIVAHVWWLGCALYLLLRHRKRILLRVQRHHSV